MKAIKVLFALCLLVSLNACQESEDLVIDLNESELIGTWNLTKLSQDGTIQVPGVTVPVPIASEGSNFDALIEITDNPNDFSAKGSFINTTIIDIPLGDSFEIEEEINLSEFFASGLWNVENGIITVSQGSLDQTISILNYDGNSVELQFDIVVPVTYNGITVQSNSTIDMTLTR